MFVTKYKPLNCFFIVMLNYLFDRCESGCLSSGKGREPADRR